MKKVIIGVIFIIIAIIAMISLVYVNLNKENLKNIPDNIYDGNDVDPKLNDIPENDRPNDNSGTGSDENPDNDDLKVNVTTTGGGGGGGGATGGESTNCEIIQISYALKNFMKNEICNNYDNGKCIDKNIICTLDVYNFDYNIAGDFSIEFKLLENENVVDTEIETKNIQSRTNSNIAHTFNVQGQIADNNFICNYKSTSIPEKQICS